MLIAVGSMVSEFHNIVDRFDPQNTKASAPGV